MSGSRISGAPRVIGGDSGRALCPLAGLLQGGSVRGSRVRPATSGSAVCASGIARPRQARASGIAMPARPARTARFDRASASPSPVSAAVSAGTACAVEGMLTPRVPAPVCGPGHAGARDKRARAEHRGPIFTPDHPRRAEDVGLVVDCARKVARRWPPGLRENPVRVSLARERRRMSPRQENASRNDYPINAVRHEIDPRLRSALVPWDTFVVFTGSSLDRVGAVGPPAAGVIADRPAR
jgi:hypothetical protein